MSFGFKKKFFFSQLSKKRLGLHKLKNFKCKDFSVFAILLQKGTKCDIITFKYGRKNNSQFRC